MKITALANKIGANGLILTPLIVSLCLISGCAHRVVTLTVPASASSECKETLARAVALNQKYRKEIRKVRVYSVRVKPVPGMEDAGLGELGCTDALKLVGSLNYQYRQKLEAHK